MIMITLPSYSQHALDVLMVSLIKRRWDWNSASENKRLCTVTCSALLALHRSSRGLQLRGWFAFGLFGAGPLRWLKAEATILAAVAGSQRSIGLEMVFCISLWLITLIPARGPAASSLTVPRWLFVWALAKACRSKWSNSQRHSKEAHVSSKTVTLFLGLRQTFTLSYEQTLDQPFVFSMLGRNRLASL